MDWPAIALPRFPALFRLLAFDGLQAAAVEVKQLSHLLLCLRCGSAAEPGRGHSRLSHASRCGYKFEQVESDIFIAPGAKARAG
jgi:hypothetical protein